MTSSRPNGKNVKLPSGSDEYCSYCGDDNVAIAIGGNAGSSCGFCSNEIVMCQRCYSSVAYQADKILER